MKTVEKTSSYVPCEKCGRGVLPGKTCDICAVDTKTCTVEEFAGMLQKAFPGFMQEMMKKKGNPGYRSMPAKNWCRLLGEFL